MSKCFFFLIAFSFVSPNIFSQNWANVDGGAKLNSQPGIIMFLKTDSINDLLFAHGFFNQAGNVTIPNLIAQYDGITWDTVQGLWNLFQYFYHGSYQGKMLFSSHSLFTWDGSVCDTLIFNWVPEQLNGMVEFNGDLVVYGDFNDIDGVAASGIAKWDGSSWSAFDSTFFGNTPYINCAIEYNGELYIGGNFAAHFGDLDRLARWNGTEWKKVGDGIHGGVETVWDMVIFNGDLIIGGSFETINGNPGNCVARWNGTHWLDMGGGLQPTNSRAFDLQVFNNELFATGVFLSAGGIPASGIAKWDGSQWCSLGYSSSILFVYTMAVYHNELYLSCGLTVNGDTMNGITKWVGGSYTDTCGAIVSIEKQIEIESICIYPNPANNSFSFTFLPEFKESSINIFDLTGKSILKQNIRRNDKVILPENMISGIYLVEINSGNQSQNLKLIKE